MVGELPVVSEMEPRKHSLAKNRLRKNHKEKFVYTCLLGEVERARAVGMLPVAAERLA